MSFFIVLNICLCYNYSGGIMIINKIEKLKNNKYKIIIDGESIITFDDVILNNNLLYKKQIDNELYDLIIKDTTYYEVYNKVIKYILKKRRSEKEISDYLISQNLNKSDLDKTILKLKRNNLINDTEYCKAFINDNLYLGNKGINKIKQQLLNQGISNEIIENELNNIDNQLLFNKLEKLVKKKISLNKKYSNNFLKQKILKELLELGYDKNDITYIIENNLSSDYSILQREFEKNYNKLKKIYKGYDLIKNIKCKMIGRGFGINQVEQLLKEKTEE